MFESKLDIRRQDQNGATPDALNAIAWPELVARLAAQRDLRGVLLTREDNQGASFNPCAAALLAASTESKHDINRDALGDRKYPRARTVDAAGGAVEGDREKL